MSRKNAHRFQYEEIMGKAPRKRPKRDRSFFGEEEMSTRESRREEEISLIHQENHESPSCEVVSSVPSLQEILNHALEAHEIYQKDPGSLTQIRFQKMFGCSKVYFLQHCFQCKTDQLKKMMEQSVNRRLCQLLNLNFSTKIKENKINHKQFLAILKEQGSDRLEDILSKLQNMEEFLNLYFEKEKNQIEGKPIKELTLYVMKVFQILNVKKQIEDFLGEKQSQIQVRINKSFELNFEEDGWQNTFLNENYKTVDQ